MLTSNTPSDSPISGSQSSNTLTGAKTTVEQSGDVVLDRWPSNPAVEEEYLPKPSTFPPGLEEYRWDWYMPPSTQFRPYDLKDASEQEKFDRLQMLHQGFYVPYPWTDDEADVSLIDSRKWETFTSTEVILSKFPEHLRPPVRTKIRRTNFARFNRHYCGAQGATVAACLFVHRELFKTPGWFREEVKSICDSLSVGVADLAQFADRVWGSK